MTIDNETIGFLILWGLVIAAAVFVVRLYEIATNVSDISDPSPTVTSVMGLKIEDGAKARVLRKKERVTLEGSGLTLHVDAVDASGNAAAGSIEVE